MGLAYTGPMAGRFFRRDISWDAYEAQVGAARVPDVSPPPADYNIAPATVQPVICVDHDRTTRIMEPMNWGLIPSWWNKPLSEKNWTSFTASSETAHEKATFRGAFRHRRCLIPMSGWYVWTGREGAKTPFAVSLREADWFCAAGLWDVALIDGSEIYSFALMTTRPNDVVAGLSTRMPVVLAPDAFERWLDPMSGRVNDLFAPYPAADMHAWAIGPDIGNVRNNHAGLIEGE